MRNAHDLATSAARAALAMLVPIGVVAGVLVVGASTPAYACSCAQLDLPSLAKQHDAVFVGTPVSVDRQGDERAYEVRVSDVYKGSPGPTTTVTTAASGASCGIHLDLNRQYLVVGDQPEPHGAVATNLCSGTGEVSDRALADLEKSLGPATPYRGPGGDTGDGPRAHGDQGHNDSTGDGDGDGDGGSRGDSGDTSAQPSTGSDDGMDTSYVVIGGVLALALGGSFLLPRLRRRGRGSTEESD